MLTDATRANIAYQADYVTAEITVIDGTLSDKCPPAVAIISLARGRMLRKTLDVSPRYTFYIHLTRYTLPG